MVSFHMLLSLFVVVVVVVVIVVFFLDDCFDNNNIIEFVSVDPTFMNVHPGVPYGSVRFHLPSKSQI